MIIDEIRENFDPTDADKASKLSEYIAKQFIGGKS